MTAVVCLFQLYRISPLW